MPDAGLHENGYTCPACELRRETANAEIGGAVDVPCNTCSGTGRIALPTQEIIARHTSWARKHYWPERERRWAAFNARQEKTA